MLSEWSSAVCAEASSQLSEATPSVQLASDVSGELARCVEARLRYVLNEARKRSWGRRGDVLSAEDFNAALEASGDERCLGHPRRDARKVDGSAAVASLDPVEVSVKEVMGREHRSRAPMESTLALRWLAVDGCCSSSSASDTVDEASLAVAAGLSSGKLDREHELYFRKVVEAIRSEPGGRLISAIDNDDEMTTTTDATLEQREVYRSLRLDAGLQRVVPYIVRFLVDEIAGARKRPIATLRHALAATRALTANSKAHIELYLHQLMPAALTCVVAKKLGMEDPETNDLHWCLRREAASCVAEICQRFGDRYANLQPRVCKTLAEALEDEKRPLGTRYGAIVGLTALGPLVSRNLVIPSAEAWCVSLGAKIKKSSSRAADDARRCIDAIRVATVVYFRSEFQPSRTSPATPLALGASKRTSSNRFKTKQEAPQPSNKKKRPRTEEATEEAAPEEQPAPVKEKKVTIPNELLESFGEAVVPFLAGAPPDLII